MKKLIFVLSVSVLLVACSESPEDAYERGYEDGISEVCYDVRRISSTFYDRLRSERVC